MRAFDLNFTRAARIFDPNFMRAGRKAARPRDKILSRERVLRGDEILSGGRILSDRALGVGEILSGGILNDGKFWIDNKILKGGEILNEASRSRIQRGFSRWILRGLYVKVSSLCPLHKFQSVSGSQTDYKFKRATALQTDRKFKTAVSLRVAYKFKTSMQKFHRGSCAAVELLCQKSRGETVLRNRIKFQSPPYAIKRLKFQGAIATAAFAARLKFGGSPRAAQCRKIRAQGQGG